MRPATLFAAMLPTVLAQPLSLSPELPTKTVAQLPNGSWFENIAARSNGDLLVTSLNDNPGLYIMRDPTSSSAEFDLIVSAEELGDVNMALGLAEIETDDEVETWGLVLGRSTGVSQAVKGSFSIWTVKFRRSKCGQESVEVKKVTDGAESSVLLNGMTAIPGVPNVALVADSAGLVARIDLNSGEFDDKSFAFTDTMAPRPNASLPIGANGVHVHDGQLYWTNSDLATIYRVALTEDGYPKAEAEPEAVVDLSDLTALIDDFIFDKEGNIWVAAFDKNSLIRVDAKTMEGKIVAGSPKELILPGVTAAAFGRGKKDQDIVYMTTSGGLGGPVDGKTEGAKVVAVDTSAFPC